jgi:glycogen debranching enzyme
MIDQQRYHSALDLLRQASTPFGFVAAVQEHDNYRRVWTRDGVISSIAAILSGDHSLIHHAGRTIDTIFKHQHPSGFIPSNVSPSNGLASYGGACGRADNPSWAVIGLCAYTLLTDDDSLWKAHKFNIQKCFDLLDAWEFNGKHLIYVPQSGDWADEYIQHGYILFDQLLRLWALKLANRINYQQSWAIKAEQITNAIKTNYWNSVEDQMYAPNLYHQTKNRQSYFWLMGFNPARIYPYFDLQANTFALLLGLGNQTQNEVLIKHLEDLLKDYFLLPSFYPAIQNTDPDMVELKDNHAYQFRNLPHQFHNGGLWPVWNSWLAAALAFHGKIDLARHVTENIHAANAQTSFNECLHGLKSTACGVTNCVWSAAGAVIAEQALAGKHLQVLFQFK